MPPKKHVHHVQHEQYKDWPSYLTTSVAEMQKTGTLCDLTISTKDGSVMFHSNILATVSQLVSSASQNGNNNRIIQMPDVSCSMLSHVVQYAYHGECHVSSHQLKELAGLAEHLQIEPLLQYCKKHMPSVTPTTLTRSQARLRDKSQNVKSDIHEESDPTIFSVSTDNDQKEQIDTSPGDGSLRKSTRNRKTSLRLIEAISDSRPRSRLKRKPEGDMSPNKSPKAKRMLESTFTELECSENENKNDQSVGEDTSSTKLSNILTVTDEKKPFENGLTEGKQVGPVEVHQNDKKTSTHNTEVVENPSPQQISSQSIQSLETELLSSGCETPKVHSTESVKTPSPMDEQKPTSEPGRAKTRKKKKSGKQTPSKIKFVKREVPPMQMPMQTQPLNKTDQIDEIANSARKCTIRYHKLL